MWSYIFTSPGGAPRGPARCTSNFGQIFGQPLLCNRVQMIWLIYLRVILWNYDFWIGVDCDEKKSFWNLIIKNQNFLFKKSENQTWPISGSILEPLHDLQLNFLLNLAPQSPEALPFKFFLARGQTQRAFNTSCIFEMKEVGYRKFDSQKYEP